MMTLIFVSIGLCDGFNLGLLTPNWKLQYQFHEQHHFSISWTLISIDQIVNWYFDLGDAVGSFICMVAIEVENFTW